ncbi:MAG: hypothetical protein OIF56_10685, partial [Cohaesibacter sp.]|nr:hypothetical protein [Cohaesibacter sp.]
DPTFCAEHLFLSYDPTNHLSASKINPRSQLNQRIIRASNHHPHTGLLYGHHLDESDLSDAEKREFIETLWYLMVSFVDLGFEVSSPKSTERGKLTSSFNSGSDNQTKKEMPTPQKKEEETNAIR